MYELLLHLFHPRNIFIQTSAEYLSLVNEQIPEIDGECVIIEPEPRDTAPAFAFAAATVASRHPNANVGIFYSDNVVQEASIDRFRLAIETGFDAVQSHPDRAVMIGVRPLYPHTGLGYIELGDQVTVAQQFSAPIFDAVSFVEKPPLELAKQLASSPRYLWNTGYKIIRAETILQLLASSDDRYSVGIPLLVSALAKNDQKMINTAFSGLPRLSFEYLVSEQAKSFLAIAADLEWSDLGDWEIIHRLLAEHQKGRLYTSGKVVKHDCQDTLLISHHRPVVAIGVQDLVVIETEEAVLVMSKNRSQELKIALQTLLSTDPKLL